MAVCRFLAYIMNYNIVL